jgi:hypothetical protein
LAVVDADYCFVTIDVGTVGKSRDSSVFNNTDIRRKLELGQVGIPGSRPFSNDNSGKCMPFVIIGD